MHTIDIIVVCAAVLVLLLSIGLLARQRFMLKAPGTFPVAYRSQDGSRWQYGVGRYAGGELRWFRSLGLGTRPSRTLARQRVRMVSHRGPDESERGSLPRRAVVVEFQDGVALAFSQGAYTGFVSWLESSAPLG